MKHIGVMLALLAIGAWSSKAQNVLTVEEEKPAEAINWLSWSEAMELSKVQKKKIMVNVYTQWCYWCKRMEASTFQEDSIASYINENFYPVKFDAEQKEDIIWREKTYKYVKSGKTGFHELAAFLVRGRMSFPTIVFLDEQQKPIQALVGYKSPPQFERIATYFGENHFLNTPWSTYKKNYKPALISE